MNNTFTKTKHRLYSLGKAAAILLFLVGLSTTASAQSTNPSPYCAATATQPICPTDWGGTFEKISFNTINMTGLGCAHSRKNYNYWNASSFPNLTTNIANGATVNLNVDISGTNQGTATNFAVWIDWNGDNDFVDAGEYAVANQNLGTGATKNTFPVTVPCSAKPGLTRMRLRIAGFDTPMNSGSSCTGFTWGETFDFDITIDPPTNPTANFFLPDTIFTGSPATFINGNPSGYVKHEWSTSVNGLNTIEQTALNFTYIFPSAGTYQVRVTSTNCIGAATITKNVVVVDPTTPPTVRFLASRNYIPLAANDFVVDELVDFLDFSTSGPTGYQWDITPSFVNALFAPVVGSYASKNVTVFFFDTSSFEVCLTASNAVGSSKLCKPAYVIIEYPSNSNKYENIICEDLRSGLDSGIVYDPGGKDNQYPGQTNLCDFTIDACDADQIEITIPSAGFGVSFTDFLRVFDGDNSGGKLLYEIGNNTALTTDKIVIAKSGKATIQFQSNAFDNGDGFAIRWKTTPRNDGPIKAGIKVLDKLSNDTLYNCASGVTMRFANATTNTRFLDYGNDDDVQWIFDYDPNIAYPVGFSDDPFNFDEEFPSYQYANNKKYTVRLVVRSCEGWDTAYKTFHLRSTTMLPQVDFTASERIITVGENTLLSQQTVAWCSGDWTIAPADYTILNSGSLSDQDIRVQFNKAGRYTVKYTAKNDNGQASRTRTDYIRVIDYCKPTVNTPLQSMSISRVKFNNVENITGLSSSGYGDFTKSLAPIPVFIGASYALEVERASNFDAADRKVWIDLNRDGIFDASEIVAQDLAAKTSILAANVTIPDVTVVTPGLTRMRVGLSFSGKPFTSCGPIDAGEYEDYPVLLQQDNVPPMITMNGNDTLYIEVGTKYTDPGATATDNREGNITPKIITVNQVDTTQTGVYVVTYNVEDGSGVKAPTRTRFVFVLADITAPVLTVTGSATVTHEVNTAYVDAGATALDNPGASILDGFIIVDNQVDTTKLGTYEVNYKVTDAYGNTATGKRTVNVVDQTAPVINSVGGNPMKVQVNSTFVDPTTVTDNYWTNVPLVVESGDVITTNFGKYKVTYSAVDGSGNAATKVTREYEVTDLVPPVLTSLSGSELIIVDVNDQKFVEPAIVATDNYYSTVDVVRTGNFDRFVLGDYTILYTGTDKAGNSSTYTRVIRVVDRVRPDVISTPANIARWHSFDPMDGVSTIDNYYGPATFDNSGNPGTGKLEVISSNVNTLQDGYYTVIYQAVDGSGNVSVPHSRLVAVTTDLVNGINDVAFGESINIYPNPTSGRFEVEFGSFLSSTASITITDITGKSILNYKGADVVNNKLSVDLTNVSAGVYLVQVTSDGNIATKKVTVTR